MGFSPFFNLLNKNSEISGNNISFLISLAFLRSELKDSTEFLLKFTMLPSQLWSQNTISAFILAHGITAQRNHRVNQTQNAPNPSCFGVFHLHIKAFHARQQFFNAFAPRMQNFHLKTLLG